MVYKIKTYAKQRMFHELYTELHVLNSIHKNNNANKSVNPFLLVNNSSRWVELQVH
jgi:hypothetical protein